MVLPGSAGDTACDHRGASVIVLVSVDSILYTTPQSSSPFPSPAGGNGSSSSTRHISRKCGWAATSRRRHAEMEGRQEYAQTACNPHRHRRLPVGLSRASSHDRCHIHFLSLHFEAYINLLLHRIIPARLLAAAMFYQTFLQ